jgi:hypothetical protein
VAQITYIFFWRSCFLAQITYALIFLLSFLDSILTRSRCGAGTISTPLLQSRARSLPSHNPGNTTPFPILSTYLGKPSRDGKSYRNWWQRTDRSPQATNFVLATMVEERLSLFFFSYVTTVTRGPFILYIPFSSFLFVEQYTYLPQHIVIVFLWSTVYFFHYTTQ